MPNADTIIILLLCCGSGAYIFFQKGIYLKKIVFATSLILLSVNYYVNRDFYPALLGYQAESQVAHFMKRNNIPADQIVFVGDVQSVADIILHRVTSIVPVDSVTASKVANKYVFASPEGQKKIDSVGLKYAVIAEFEDFPVTRLTGKFINRKTRFKEVRQKFLLKTGPVEIRPPAVDVTIR
ncbi:MAG: hypothetical protein H0X41_11145 [Chitinophagaceae bacterium]|nr:hypothetical protein [Chitinophagaceae bacterium]